MSSPTVAKAANPFPGLRPFRDEEEHLFFGRESQVDTMVDKLAETRFLAVVGTSGSGKSSLVNCGLRPALHRGMMAKGGTEWRMAQCRPGSDPFRAMARGLAAEGVLFSGFDSPGLSLADILEASLRMSKLGLADVYEQAQLAERVNLLVVVDQFEELFRYQMLRSAAAGAGQDRSQEAKAFVSLLLEACAQTDFPIYIVLTMRSDFLGDCAEFSGLPEAINRGQYLVPRLTRDERREAIAGPVGVGGGEISPVLLTRLVNDVGDNPDQLSILQHALNRTWDEWQNKGGFEGRLELTHYEAIGTMAHALDRHAEEAYEELASERQKQICERIFKALTDRGTDTRGIRRPMRLRTLCDLAEATQAEVAHVIDVFRKPSRSFLMPPFPEPLQPDTVIDISHESLMRVWGKLNDWAEKEAESARMYRRLAETATLWASGEASLWRDAPQALALKWREDAKPTEVWAGLYGGGFEQAMSFLAASEAQRHAEEREKDERLRKESERAQALALAQQEARTAPRLRRWAIAAGALAILAVIFGIIALKLERAAEAEGARDEQAKNEAVSLRFAATAIESLGEIEDVDPERGVLLALQSASAAFTSEAEKALLRTLRAFRLQQSLQVPAGTSQAVAFTDDGRRLAAVSGDSSAGEVTLLDIDSRKQPAPLVIPGGVKSSAVSPDGKYLATAGFEGTVRLWDLTKPGQVGNILKHNGAVRALSFGADGRRLATASGDRKVRLWEVPSGLPIKEMEHSAAVTAVAVTRDGKRLATISQASQAGIANGSGNVLALWDLNGDKPTRRNFDTGGEIVALSFSPDGKTLVTVSSMGVASIWNVANARNVGQITDHDIRVVAFSPDSTRLATAGSEKLAVVWEVATRHELFTLSGHKRNIADIAFSPDGKRLATVSPDGTAKIWRALSGGEEHMRGKELIDTARARVTRSLTSEECVEYQVDSQQCRDTKAAEAIVREGRAFAGRLEVADAIATFQRAKKIDPNLKLDPIVEANRVGLLPLLDKAKRLIQQNEFGQAMQAYSAAVKAYEAAKGLDQDRKKLANAWNDFCWEGTLRGHAHEVMDSCSLAVKLAAGLEPDIWNVRDSRGLARTLNHDFAGAIEDFEFYRSHSAVEAFRLERESWIAALRKGQNPFSEAVLKGLRTETTEER